MIKKRGFVFSLFLFLSLLAANLAADSTTSNDDYLHVSGTKIYDKNNNEVRLTGINFFGFETEDKVFNGLWSRNMVDMLDLTASLGFNILRLPLSVQLVNDWRSGVYPMPEKVNYQENPELEGLNSLEILDMALDYCGRVGIKVLLDMHRVVNTHKTPLWFSEDYPVKDFIDCWVWLVERYKGTDTVIAIDVFNEPHGKPWEEASAQWNGSQGKDNFKWLVETVAGEIHKINPELLIFAEGIHSYPKEGLSYDTARVEDDFYVSWWGGNLRGARDFPIDLGDQQDKLVYAPHDYGPDVFSQPWFYEGFNYQTLMDDVWYDNWFYLYDQGISPIFFGEWGGTMSLENRAWMDQLRSLISEYQLHFTFWCLNENSEDTGGILMNNFQDVDIKKYEYVKEVLWKDENGLFIGLDHQKALNPISPSHEKNGTSVTVYYGGVLVTPEPTIPPTPIPTSSYYGKVALYYNNGNAVEEEFEIKPQFIIENNTTDDLSFEDITVQYYYSKEGSLPEICEVDYSVLGSSNILPSFHEGYLEIGFSSGAGIFTAGTDSGEVLLRFYKTNYSNYNQSNDYSFNSGYTSFSLWDHMTVLYKGELVWGIHPYFSGGPTPSLSPTPTLTPEPTPSLSPTPTLTPEPTPSLSPTPTLTPEPTPSLSPTPTLTPEPIPTSGITPTPFYQPTGDVNNDDKVSVIDALMIAQWSVGLTVPGFLQEEGDVNLSGSIDIIDALMVAQYYVGLIDKY